MSAKSNTQIRKLLYGIMLLGVVVSNFRTSGVLAARAKEVGTEMPISATTEVQSCIPSSVPPAPILAYPDDLMAVNTTTPVLQWSPVSISYCVDYYLVQVYEDGGGQVDISWPTSSSYSIPSGKLLEGRRYWWYVWAHNSMGFGDNRVWSFWIGPPTNDDLNNSSLMDTFPYSNKTNTRYATTATDDPIFTCVSSQANQSVWYRYAPPSSGTLTLDTYGSNFNTVLGMWTGNRGSLSSVGCNDDFTGNTVQSYLQIAVTGGQIYYIEVGSKIISPSGFLTLNGQFVPCYALTRTHTGSGSDPSATPVNSSACPAGQYHADESITLTAVPDNGWVVSSWNGTDNDSSTSTTNTLTMPPKDWTIKTNYRLNSYGLSVSKSGTGSGTVTSSPSGINCGSTCSYSFNSGTIVTLTATPTSPSTFGGWSGVCTGISTCIVNMSTDRSITATFNLPGNQISIATIQSSAGTSGSLGLLLSNQDLVASGEVWLSYDSSNGLDITGVEITSRTSGFSTGLSEDTSDPAQVKVHILFYNLQGTTIATGNGSILGLNFNLSASASGTTTVHIDNGLLSDSSGSPVAVSQLNDGSITVIIPANGRIFLPFILR